MKVEYQLALLLFGVHWGPLVAAAILWPMRSVRLSVRTVIAALVGLSSAAIVFVSLFVFGDVRTTAQGNGVTWYLIFSLMTLGIAPTLVISAHIMVGRWIGYFYRRGAHDELEHITN